MTNQATGLEQRIRDLEVAPGSITCVWLGQASFLFKSPQGVIVMIDPYLSDWGEEQWGLKRVIPPPIDPQRLHPDLLLVSHWHEDHLDAPLIKQWARMAFPGIFVGPLTCSSRALAWGWPDDRVVELMRGAEMSHQDVTVRATYARHDTPTAPCGDEVGFLVDVGGFRVWYVGDTEYDAHLRALKDEAVDVALVPINGVGGNMNADEAAMLMWIVAPRIAVPMHYNMWAPEAFGPGATLDPGRFIETHAKLGGTAEIRTLPVGEIVVFE
jgi:L-ascorbate 6-phosphate lactonase